MQRIKRKKNPLQGECWREKQIACHIPSHSTFNRFCNFRLCRGGWFTDMKMFHMPSVCFWNRTVSRLGTLGPCCGCFQSAVWEILRQPYNKVGQTWIIFDVYPSFFPSYVLYFYLEPAPFSVQHWLRILFPVPWVAKVMQLTCVVRTLLLRVPGENLDRGLVCPRRLPGRLGGWGVATWNAWKVAVDISGVSLAA